MKTSIFDHTVPMPHWDFKKDLDELDYDTLRDRLQTMGELRHVLVLTLDDAEGVIRFSAIVDEFDAEDE